MGYYKEVNYPEQAVVQVKVTQICFDCPIPGGVQGQAGEGLGQTGVVEGVPAHGRQVRMRWILGL